MTVQVIDPGAIHKPTTYAQASISSGSRIVCLAGQAALDSHGKLVGAGDLAAQTRLWPSA